MQSFLEKVTDYITDCCDDDPGSVCIVTPNRRAGIFIRKLIAAKYKQPVWAPEVRSVEDFVFSVSGLRQCDNLALLFRLFHVHVALDETAASFHDFLRWGQALLDDFNEIDLQLADAEVVFSFLSEAKAIGAWNPDGSALTEFQERYLDFYRSMIGYYRNLNETLTREGLAYKGMAYRRAAENISQRHNSLTWKKIYFTGLNALTNAEEKLIRFLVNEGKAELLWDADRYYTDNPNQEAGMFMRKYLENPFEKEFRWKADDLSSRPARIELIGVPGYTAQARAVGEILETLGAVAANTRTAVVLADESMLLPVMNSIPSCIRDFNVTMGLPMKQLPIYTFIVQWIGMHTGAKGLPAPAHGSGKGLKSIQFRLRDLNLMSDHPLIHDFLNETMTEDAGSFSETRASWVKQNRIIVNADEIRIAATAMSREAAALLDLIITPFPDDYRAADLFLEAFALIRDKKLLKNADITEIEADSAGNAFQASSLEIEYLFHFARLFKRLRTTWQQSGVKFGPETMQLLIESLAATISLPFSGEPLKGLQVMGMLETRTLDFDTVILLSANEGYLPSTAKHNSFIPFDIQREFGLQTHIERNAVFAYHFYRLLQRAGNIYLIYNTEAGTLGGEEMSRFLLQLKHEYVPLNPAVRLVERPGRPLELPAGLRNEVVVEKSPEVMELLRRKASHGLSPSSLNLFRSCALRFYLSEIARISKTDEIEEVAAASDLGSGIHDALKRLYQPYVGRVMKAGDYERMLGSLEQTLALSFNEGKRFIGFSRGKNLLLFKAACRAIERYLKAERQLLASEDGRLLSIHALEESLKIAFDPGSGSHASGNHICFKGSIDRLDHYGDYFRLLDYKTGYVKPSELSLDAMDELDDKPGTEKIFQLLFYCLLASDNKTDAGPILAPGIISLRSSNPLLMPVKVKNRDTVGTDELAEFSEYLRGLLNALFDQSLPFSQTTDNRRCEYCHFRDICVR